MPNDSNVQPRLPKSKLPDFKRWLTSRNLVPLKLTVQMVAANQAVRWHGEPGKPMPIVYSRSHQDYCTCNNSAKSTVAEFLKLDSEKSIVFLVVKESDSLYASVKFAARVYKEAKCWMQNDAEGELLSMVTPEDYTDRYLVDGSDNVTYTLTRVEVPNV